MASPTFIRVLSGVGLAAFVLPLLGILDDHSAAVLGTAFPAGVIAIAVAELVLRLRHRPPTRVIGGVIVATCAWLFSQARAGAINWLLAALLGLGVALCWTGRLRDRIVLASAAVTAVTLVVVAAVWGAGPAWVCGAGTGLALVLASTLDRSMHPVSQSTGWLAPVVGLLGVLLVGSWIGANSPTAPWFGATIAHGPRDEPQVAITFDDGPNAGATMAIAHILDAHGAKGTFFSVGKAVEARPDITRALIADGQLVANHSFHHDEWRWLDPRYPELVRAQRAIRQQAGVCPAFYRPPHGQHTPLMSWVMHRNDVTMIGWDVSAGDWATNAPQVIANRVLSKVRRGSIIDLHDGLDGKVDANRSVLVRAMPLILDGLAARYLQPVRLDQLLGRSGYTDHC